MTGYVHRLNRSARRILISPAQKLSKTHGQKLEEREIEYTLSIFHLVKLVIFTLKNGRKHMHVAIGCASGLQMGERALIVP
jgi:hypothetical protein